MSAKIARANRFRVPPHPPKERADYATIALRYNRKPVVTLVAIRMGHWRREKGKGGDTEVRDIVAVRSDGKTHRTKAIIAYERGERQRLMEDVLDPEKIMARGVDSLDRIQQRVYDRRCRAVERVLGLFAKRFGALPTSTELQHGE